MSLSHHDLVFRLATALVLGGAIGWERQTREVPAGLRTHLLVALASATFTLVSLYLAFYQHVTNVELLRLDAGRIASNIVVGMGFLGGGAILRSGMSVHGLTTAASLWLTAAIGMAAGGGMYLLATVVTVLCLFTLSVLRYSVEQPRRKIVNARATVRLEAGVIGRPELIAQLRSVGATVRAVDYHHDMAAGRCRLTLNLQLRDESCEEPLIQRLEALPGVREVDIARVD